jgi:hypothetical protein
MKNTTDMELVTFGYNFMLYGGEYIDIEKTDSTYITVDNHFGVYDSYTITATVEGETYGTIDLDVVRVTTDDNVVYSFILINENDFKESAVNDFEVMLDSVDIIK